MLGSFDPQQAHGVDVLGGLTAAVRGCLPVVLPVQAGVEHRW